MLAKTDVLTTSNKAQTNQSEQAQLNNARIVLTITCFLKFLYYELEWETFSQKIINKKLSLVYFYNNAP